MMLYDGDADSQLLKLTKNADEEKETANNVFKFTHSFEHRLHQISTIFTNSYFLVVLENWAKEILHNLET